MPDTNIHDPIVRRPSAAVRWTIFLGKGILLFVLILVGIWTWNNTPLSHWMREANARSAHSADDAATSRDKAKLVQEETRSQVDANRVQHQKLLDEAADTIRRLDELAKLREQWLSRVAALRETAEGTQLASDPELVAAFAQLTSTRTPPELNVQALRARVETIRQLSEQRLRERDVTAAPATPAVEEVASASRTAVQSLDAYRQANLEVEALVQQGKSSGRAPSSASLADALVEHQAKAKQQELAAYTAAAEKAMAEVKDKIVAEAEASAKRREEERVKFLEARLAQLEEHQKQLQQVELDRDKQEHKAELTKAEQDAEKAAVLARKEQEDRDREKKKIEDEAKHNALVARALSPEVQELLKPVLTPAYYQPGKKSKVDTEMHPMSYSGLVEAGAMEDSTKGLYTLLQINDNEEIRPSWPFTKPRGLDHKRWGRDYPDAMAGMKKAQDALRELGPTLVELNLLMP